MKKFAVIAVLLLAAFAVVSCSKPQHDVYFKVSGTAVDVDIDCYTYKSNSIFSSPIDSVSTTATSLPWTSSTFTLVEGNVATVTGYISDSVTSNPSITIEIYKDGTVAKTVTVSGSYNSGTLSLTL